MSLNGDGLYGESQLNKTGGGWKGKFLYFQKVLSVYGQKSERLYLFVTSLDLFVFQVFEQNTFKKTWHAELKPAHAPAGKVLNSSSRNFYVFPFNKSKKGQAELDSVPRCIK